MRERIVAVDGAELWVAEQGAGEPLILCPGGPGCCDYLGPIAEMIDDLATVYRFDPRGCGRSSVAGSYDVATCLADLDGLRAALGYERWAVGGHSWGAFLALAYAIEFPERVTRLVYLSGAGVQNDRRWHAAYKAGKEAGREPEPEMAFPPNMEVNRAGNDSTAEYCQQPDLLRRIAQVAVPLLAVSGSEDIRPDWPVRQIVNLMPNARFELIDGAPHDLWLSYADQLRVVLRDFLAATPEPSDQSAHRKA
jgi:proline iminopeptidase